MFFFVLGICDFDDLSVADIPATGNAQQDKNGRKDTSQSQPLVDKMPHKKAEDDTAGHGKAQLHDDR